MDAKQRSHTSICDGLSAGDSSPSGVETTAVPNLPIVSFEVFHVRLSTEALDDSDSTEGFMPKWLSYVSDVPVV